MFCLDGSQVDVSKVDGGGGGGGEHDGHRHQSGCRASSHGGGKHRCKADFFVLAKRRVSVSREQQKRSICLCPPRNSEHVVVGQI